MTVDLRAQTVAQIQVAFADTPAPAADTHWNDSDECEGINKEWAGKHWRDITVDMLFNRRGCLEYLAPDAFRFYLPTFLIHALTHPAEVDILMDVIMGQLAPQTGRPTSLWHNRRLTTKVANFTAAEAGAVIAFLDTFRALVDANVQPFMLNHDDQIHFEAASKFWGAVRDNAELPVELESPYDQRRAAYQSRRILKNKSITAFRLPTSLGLRPPAPDRVPGTYKAPDALMNAGLLTMLNAIDGGRIEPRPYAPDIEAATNVRNRRAICLYSWFIAQMVSSLVPDGVSFPLLIGGDCSILIGAAIGLKRVGRYGLIFMDGHTDFQTPETSESKAAAGMDLAIITGYGADKLTNMENLKPYMRESDIVVFGNRDIEDRATYYAKLIFETDVSMITLDYARQLGIELAAAQAVELLKQRGVEGFWIHLDADVLDSVMMPAVDSVMPGGMSYAEMIAALRVFLRSGLAVGMEITIYDPDLDPDRSIARAYVDALVEGFHEPAAE